MHFAFGYVNIYYFFKFCKFVCTLLLNFACLNGTSSELFESGGLNPPSLIIKSLNVMHLIVFKIVPDEVNEIYAATLFTKMISRDLSILQSTNNIDNRKLRFTDIPDLPLLFLVSQNPR